MTRNPKLTAIAKRLAGQWAEENNEASSHCGAYGDETWTDYIAEAWTLVDEILEAAAT